MTLEEFNNIKVGQSCYLPDSRNKNRFYSVQILGKDKFFKKLKVMLNNQWLSYKYLQLNKGSQCSCVVGIVANYDYDKRSLYGRPSWGCGKN